MQGIPEAQNMKKGKYWREYHFVFDLLPHSGASMYWPSLQVGLVALVRPSTTFVMLTDPVSQMLSATRPAAPLSSRTSKIMG